MHKQRISESLKVSWLWKSYAHILVVIILADTLNAIQLNDLVSTSLCLDQEKTCRNELRLQAVFFQRGAYFPANTLVTNDNVPEKEG